MDWIDEWDQAAFFAVNHGLHQDWLNPFMWLITSLGLGWVQFILLLLWAWNPFRFPISGFGFRVLGHQQPTTNNHQPSSFKLRFLPGLLALVGSGVTVQVIKHFWNRPRPSNLPGALVAGDERLFAYSFPSGHTATSFALAFFVWYALRGTRGAWGGWLAWGLAALVGLSRIYRGLHYPSDVLAAALIGLLWGWMAIIAYNRLKQRGGVRD